jgi:hypothetical protein
MREMLQRLQQVVPKAISAAEMGSSSSRSEWQQRWIKIRRPYFSEFRQNS